MLVFEGTYVRTLLHRRRDTTIANQADKYPAELSGGQQQRAAIARSLAMAPKVMLFDEPTSALDPEMINEVLGVMTDLAADGMTMLVITHEMGFARRAANKVVFMDDGPIVESAEPAVFFESPQSERAKDFWARFFSISTRLEEKFMRLRTCLESGRRACVADVTHVVNVIDYVCVRTGVVSVGPDRCAVGTDRADGGAATYL